MCEESTWFSFSSYFVAMAIFEALLLTINSFIKMTPRNKDPGNNAEHATKITRAMRKNVFLISLLFLINVVYEANFSTMTGFPLKNKNLKL